MRVNSWSASQKKNCSAKLNKSVVKKYCRAQNRIKNLHQETGEVGGKGHDVAHAMWHPMHEKEQMKRRNGNVRMV